MRRISTTIEIVTVCHAASGEIFTRFLWNRHPGYDYVELWRGRKTGRLFLYNPHVIWNDEKLDWRRRTGNMMSPIKPWERLTYLADVYHRDRLAISKDAELSRAKLKLKTVFVDWD